MALAGFVKGGDAAKIAAEIAAAGKFHQRDVLVLLAGEYLTARSQATEGLAAVSLVALLKDSVAGIIENLRPVQFGIADDNRIRFSLSQSTAYASAASLNFSSAARSPGLRSGWY